MVVVALIIASRLNWQNQFETLYHTLCSQPACSLILWCNWFLLSFLNFPAYIIYVMSCGNTQDPNTVFTTVLPFMIFMVNVWLFQIEGEHSQEISTAWSCICTYAPVYPVDPGRPRVSRLAPQSAPTETRGRGERRRAGRASDQSAARIRGRGPIRGRLGKWGKLAAGRAGLVWPHWC